jgi:hypothetical protein
VTARRAFAVGAASLCAALLLGAASAPADIASLKRAFAEPPDDARIMMRWWWFGPAVQDAELERELRAMKAGGIGGVEIQPVYPVALDDQLPGVRNAAYLSPEFLDRVRFANQTARGLGLRVDITLGSGWPYGGPHTTVELASPRLRVERVAVAAGADSAALPKTAEGERLLAAFVAPGAGQRFPLEAAQRVEVSNGAARFAKREAPCAVLFFISSRTRQAVKRAGVGAEGFVLDHYSRAAIDEHLKQVGEPLLNAFGANPPYAVFSDSLEVYNSDWNGDFLAEFQKRRGYDLTPYLPALAADVGEKTGAVRADWGKTLTELAEERYLTPVREWARRHGALFRSQTYGTPPVTISSGALVDLPEGEGSQWRTLSSTRWASSSSHLYGKPVTSSETWTWLNSPVFRATPLDMKAEADLHFLQGVNQLVGHGWPYSPPEAGEPGWRFYAAAAFNDHNPWYPVMPDVARYLQRVSFLLRQGKPVNDVAVYLPTSDAYARFTLGRASVNEGARALLGPELVSQILDAGYNLDFIDDAAIAKLGVPYGVLVLPGVERMPLATLQKIDEYARKGGRVFATVHAPTLPPGLKEAETDGAALRALSAALFEGVAARAVTVTDESKLGAALRGALTPDVVKPAEVGFVHRHLEYADFYFIANTANHPVKGAAEFRVKGLNAAWWDPLTGAITKAEGGRVELSLAPYESRILVFSRDRAPAARVAAGAVPTPVDLSGGWKLAFPNAAPVELPKLTSWTELEGRSHYSGAATYERSVTIDAAMLKPGRAVYLDFGEGSAVTADTRRSGSGMRAMFEGPVREAAVVYVNGARAGSVWSPPYAIDVTRLLRPGANQLRAEVMNLALNRMAGVPAPDYKPLIAKYGDRFQDQDVSNLKPLPSGLLGRIQLVAK